MPPPSPPPPSSPSRLVRLFTKSWIHFAIFFLDWLLNAPTWMLHTYYGSIPLHLLASRVFLCLFFPPTPLYNLLFLYSMQYLFTRRNAFFPFDFFWTANTTRLPVHVLELYLITFQDFFFHWTIHHTTVVLLIVLKKNSWATHSLLIRSVSFESLN